MSPFGHGYVTNDGYAEIEFFGSQIAIMTKSKTGAKFSVSIDGKQEIVCEFDGTSDLMYLCGELENKQHKIVIKAITEIDISAVAIR